MLVLTGLGGKELGSWGGSKKRRKKSYPGCCCRARNSSDYHGFFCFGMCAKKLGPSIDNFRSTFIRIGTLLETQLEWGRKGFGWDWMGWDGMLVGAGDGRGNGPERKSLVLLYLYL